MCRHGSCCQHHHVGKIQLAIAEINFRLHARHTLLTQNFWSLYKSRSLYTWIHPSDFCALLQKLNSCFVKIWMHVAAMDSAAVARLQSHDIHSLRNNPATTYLQQSIDIQLHAHQILITPRNPLHSDSPSNFCALPHKSDSYCFLHIDLDACLCRHGPTTTTTNDHNHEL